LFKYTLLKSNSCCSCYFAGTTQSLILQVRSYLRAVPVNIPPLGGQQQLFLMGGW